MNLKVCRIGKSMLKVCRIVKSLLKVCRIHLTASLCSITSLRLGLIGCNCNANYES